MLPIKEHLCELLFSSEMPNSSSNLARKIDKFVRVIRSGERPQQCKGVTQVPPRMFEYSIDVPFEVVRFRKVGLALRQCDRLSMKIQKPSQPIASDQFLANDQAKVVGHQEISAKIECFMMQSTKRQAI